MVTGVVEKWSQSVHEQHAEAAAAGLHDEDCEWRAEGYWLCHCSKRRREAQGLTEPPGPLEFVSPICPRCNGHVDHDGDTFVCYDCCCHWPDPHRQAAFTDDYGDLDPDGWLERHRTAHS